VVNKNHSRPLLILCTFCFYLVGCQSFALEPWFTGPAIAIQGKVVPKGTSAIQPYAYYTDSHGYFDVNGVRRDQVDVHSTANELLYFFGIADKLDGQILVGSNQRYQRERAASGFADSRLLLGYQLLEGVLNDPWQPYIKLMYLQYFPTGRYRNLSPLNADLEANGTGTFRKRLALTVQDYFKLKNGHTLSNRLFLAYQFKDRTHVTGFNSYGGGYSTNGRVHVGYGFVADTSFEYQLTQNWVAMVELNYSFNDKSTFTGNPGFDLRGNPAKVGNSHNYIFSVLPGFQYNFSSKFGVFMMLWTSVKGRNSGQFVTGLMSFYATID